MNIIKYNTDLYPFAKKLQKLFSTNTLDIINENVKVFSREQDQKIGRAHV